MIIKPILPPLKGYVEKVNHTTGDHYYVKLNDNREYITKTIQISKSDVFRAPEAKNQIFQIELIGGGGAYYNLINGSDGRISINEMKIDKNMQIPVSIGAAGVGNLNGGTSSFGEYFYALGGASGIESLSKIYNSKYGKGGTADSEATDGVCIITYQAPVYN